MIKIMGERIYLRDHIAGDLNTFHAWMSDPIITRYTSLHSDSLAQSSKSLQHALDQNNAVPRKDYFFSIVEIQTEQIIGEAGFSIQTGTGHNSIAEIGYFLFQPFWGKGFAVESAKIMIDFCFSDLELNKVIAGCDTRNTASEKVMIRCGMQKEAYLKKHRFIDNIWRDRVEYAILHTDWLNKQQKIATVSF